jgi:hypothetical protein
MVTHCPHRLRSRVTLRGRPDGECGGDGDETSGAQMANKRRTALSLLTLRAGTRKQGIIWHLPEHHP